MRRHQGVGAWKLIGEVHVVERSRAVKIDGVGVTLFDNNRRRNNARLDEGEGP